MTASSAAAPAVSRPDSAEALTARLREVAEEAARAVGGPLRQAFRSPAMQIDYKADLHDPVTAHDRATEAALKAHLLAAVPGSAFVGEESGLTAGAAPDAIRWVVDPIDGTANFAAGIAVWCVSIAAVRGDELLAGVVFDPMAGNLFAADAAGARVNGAPLAPRPARPEARAALICSYPVARDLKLDSEREGLADYAELLQAFSTVRRLGSAALTLCHVAAGWSDAALGLGINAWDVSAAMLVLRRAGGEYRPLRLGKVAEGTVAQNCPGYLAQLAGGTYPTLHRVADRIETRRNRAAPDRTTSDRTTPAARGAS